MALQLLIPARAMSFGYFQGEATPDKQSLTTGHAVARVSSGQFFDIDAIMPLAYAGGSITARISLFSLTATTGNMDWSVAIERLAENGKANNANNFATSQSSAPKAISGTLSATTYFDIAFSAAQFDNIVAGDGFRARVTRVASTVAGDLYVKSVQFLSDI